MSSSSYGRGSYTNGYQSDGSVSGEFDRLASSVSSNIQKIAQNTSRCERLVAQIGTPQDRGNLTGQIRELQHQSKGLAQTATTQLRNLSESIRHAPADVKRQREQRNNRLQEEFTSILNKMQKVQRETADKERASVLRARANSATSSNPFADADDYTSGAPHSNDLVNYDDDRKQSSMQAVIDEEENLTAIREREEAIQNLETDILDVNQIFKDLGSLVHEQGEMIDSIESNVESAAVHVDMGNQQLHKAADYQSAARKKKCICFIVLAIAAVVITLVIVLPIVLKPKNN